MLNRLRVAAASVKSSYTAAVVLNWGVLVADGSCKVYLIMLKNEGGSGFRSCNSNAMSVL